MQEEEPQNAKFSKKRKRNASDRNKRGRIIVRNLPFSTTEAKLKEHFDKYGRVIEVKLLKRPDGKLVGCGFVQFEVVQNAAKAIFHTSGKPFLGREIICDWALNKNSYVANIQETIKTEVKQEEISDNDTDTKSEIITHAEISKTEKNDEIQTDDLPKEITLSDDDKNSDEEKNSDESESSDDDELNEEKESEEPEAKKPRFISNDISEGKTVFVKNVPFSATNDDLKNCMMQFGPIYYALICIDRLTEHSKGTAFVKFKSQDDAEKCLQAGTELTLLGNILDCHKAVSKNEIEEKNFKNEERIKDSRNLYLMKEGVIMAGSKSAEGVSSSDMSKRLELEKSKSQMLKNLNMFISRYRLIVHNLPANFNNQKLKKIFAKVVDSSAVMKEARVMLDLKKFDKKGKPISKGYGFVSFSKHEDALKALRALNNNPDVFSVDKRPIVSFSIENKAVMNARKKRLEKSKIHNPKCKEYDPKAVKENSDKTNSDKNSQVPKYMGETATVGKTKMRSKSKMVAQAQMFKERKKEEKKTLKLRRKHLQFQNKNKKGQPNIKSGRKKHNYNKEKVPEEFSRRFSAPPPAKKRKWYES